MNKYFGRAVLTGLFGAAMLAGTALGQAGRSGNASLAIPSGDRATSIVLIETTGPAEVRVGQNYDYSIKVTNLKDNLTLEDVRIEQVAGENLSVESSEPEAERGEGGRAAWTIDRLGPGESKTIKVRGLGDEEGDVAMCLRVTYTPSLCLTTRFVKPQLSVTKNAPERVDICELIPLRYTVTNPGTAAVNNVRLRDKLPEGLKTADGKDTYTADVGTLAAGQSKDFTVNAYATDTGEFSSRAVAEAANDLSARSEKPTTRVVASELAVDIRGSEAEYIDDPVTYRVAVRNTGDAVARGTNLEVNIDEKSRLIRTSRSAPGNVAPKQPGPRTLTWALGDLKPDEERAISFTVIGQEAGTLEHRAIATSVCAGGRDREIDTARATAVAETEVLTFPALLLEMVDQNDPVRVGNVEVYTISVINQGTGEDRNVQITCELPGEFEYVDAAGPTNAKADGNTITFGKVDRLAPGNRVTWQVRARANKEGDVRTTVKLNSEYLSRPVTEEEPTRLVGSDRVPEGRDRSGNSGGNNRSGGNNNSGSNNSGGNNQNKGSGDQ